MASNNICNPELRLDLGLALNNHQFSENCMKKKKVEVPSNYCIIKAYPSLTLGPPNKYGEGNNNNINEVSTKTESEEHFHPQASSPSVVSNNSFSNTTSSTINKRERLDRFEVEEFELEEEKILSRDVDEDENGNPKKKLRLTKEQSAVLEYSFKEHSTLNPSQKQELARKLNLRARQVEVWFQNRRARSKLKQTEVDYELLKKYSEDLREENKRLQKELQELKSMKTTPPSFFMQLPAVTSLTICPSCNRMCGGNDGGDNNASSTTSTALLIGPKAHNNNHHLYKNNYPFAQSSATC